MRPEFSPAAVALFSGNFRLKHRSLMWNDKQRDILAVAREYKDFLFLYLVILIFATMFESVGLGLLMPIFQTIQGIETNHVLTAYAEWGFGVVGLEFSLINLIALFTFAMLVKYALVALSMRFARVLSARIACDMRERIFRNLMELPLSFFYRKKVGDLLAVQFTSANNCGFVFEHVMLITNAVFFCVLYLILNLMVSFSLSVLVLGLTSISWFFLLPWFRKAHEKGAEESQGVENVSSYLHDVFSGIKTVKVFGNLEHHIENYTMRTSEYRQVSVRIMDNRIIASFFYEPLIFLMMVFCLVVSVEFLEIPFFTLTVFLAIFLQVLPKLKLVGNYWLIVSEFAPHLARVREFTERKVPECLPEETASIGSLEKGVRFENVSFTYPGAQGDALSGINASIEKDATTALVGSSGSGKTTFVDLFLRLHDPAQGVIYVDDVDLRDVSASQWRSRIGVVEQDPYLFNDTIYNNIRYGDLSVDEAGVRKAAEIAYAHEFITQMPEGYRTIIGNRGFKLSGGQKQRLALARALVRSPPILVLDEATSSLDSGFERLIWEAVRNLGGRMTILIVAHRLSTIRDADKILVLEGGRIVEEGDHSALMRMEGWYRKFVELQS
ncbi:MAG: ABC transporter ATP-binding protein [Nitrospinae bacterium]|nr:ABC transporter ATP-binding protein [Nitrospinota bacterium]